ncbi:MAG TPA: ParB/RepB/Spo0J family partition protein [Microbacteriaceae bacterium]|nr:ParB/RepB/Spo0J family partition protein [Microbacteriaceae bacterium]
MVAKKKSGLGRGIGALIPQTGASEERPVDVFFSSRTEKDESSVAENLQEVPGASLTTLDVSDVIPNRAQPRREFDEEAMQELTHSVREFGLFQPIVVRLIHPKPKKGEPRYELIMGERRLRAAKRANLTNIPAIIRGTEDEHMLRDALLENLHRAQLNPLEEASAYQQLMQDFGATQEELAQKIGRSRPQISNTIRLLKLPETVQTKVAAGVLTAGHARAILSLDGDIELMEKFADKIINEGLSVRAAEEVATKMPKRRLPKPRAGGLQGQLDEIAERLGDRFNTKVHVKLGAKKGQVAIDFATIDDLKRILTELGDPGFS